MKKLVVAILVLGSVSSFAAVKEFQINCTKGFFSFQDRADGTYVHASEIFPVPPLVQGVTTGIELFKSSTHMVAVSRYKSQVSISLDKKIDETTSEIVGSAQYLLLNGNTIGFTLKDSNQELNVLNCRIEKI